MSTAFNLEMTIDRSSEGRSTGMQESETGGLACWLDFPEEEESMFKREICCWRFLLFQVYKVMLLLNIARQC